MAYNATVSGAIFRVRLYAVVGPSVCPRTVRIFVSRKTLGEHIFVCEVAPRLGERHDLPPQRFKLADAKLATKGLPGDLAPVSSRPTTHLG